MSNNSYYVTIPIAGHAYVSVDNVASKQEAKEKAKLFVSEHEIHKNVEIQWEMHSEVEVEKI